MLFRDINGKLIELNRYDFKNDKLYYQKIMEIKKPIIIHSNTLTSFAKLEKTLN